MKINYVVPELHKYGGIQEFAKSISLELEEFNIKLINWENDLSIVAKAIMKFSPAKIASLLYRNYFCIL